MKEALTTAK